MDKMKRPMAVLLCLIMCVSLLTGCAGGETPDAGEDEPVGQQAAEAGAEVNAAQGDTQLAEDKDLKAYLKLAITDEASLNAVIEGAWEEYLAEAEADETRAAEIKDRRMTYGEATMKYGILVKGKADENGYPLYIAMHGGGQSDTPDINDSQWAQMALYYSGSVKNGVYVNPRGVRDTWDTHFNPESYPLYDRLIENMILFYNVDPNRVYLMGYSAGGDGVYAISPRMTDRFAAANMSAGHPNGTSLLNLCDMPIQLQVGRLDTSYDRHLVTARYGEYLDSLQAEYGDNYYTHRVFVHTDYAHNFYDNKNTQQNVVEDPTAWEQTGEYTAVKADTNAVNFLKQYTRDPLPEYVVWDLTTRAPMRSVEANYWLSAPQTETAGLIVAEYSREDNTVTIIEDGGGADFDILLNDAMVDVFRPVNFVTPKGTYTVQLELSADTVRKTMYERGDVNYIFPARVSYKELGM